MVLTRSLSIVESGTRTTTTTVKVVNNGKKKYGTIVTAMRQIKAEEDLLLSRVEEMDNLWLKTLNNIDNCVLAIKSNLQKSNININLLTPQRANTHSVKERIQNPMSIPTSSSSKVMGEKKKKLNLSIKKKKVGASDGGGNNISLSDVGKRSTKRKSQTLTHEAPRVKKTKVRNNNVNNMDTISESSFLGHNTSAVTTPVRSLPIMSKTNSRLRDSVTRLAKVTPRHELAQSVLEKEKQNKERLERLRSERQQKRNEAKHQRELKEQRVREQLKMHEELRKQIMIVNDKRLGKVDEKPDGRAQKIKDFEEKTKREEAERKEKSKMKELENRKINQKQEQLLEQQRKLMVEKKVTVAAAIVKTPTIPLEKVPKAKVDIVGGEPDIVIDLISPMPPKIIDKVLPETFCTPKAINAVPDMDVFKKPLFESTPFIKHPPKAGVINKTFVSESESVVQKPNFESMDKNEGEEPESEKVDINNTEEDPKPNPEDNICIAYLNSDDSDDDTQGDQKLPSWVTNKRAILEQMLKPIPWRSIYRPAETLPLDLDRLFANYEFKAKPRTSSAVWKSPVVDGSLYSGSNSMSKTRNKTSCSFADITNRRFMAPIEESENGDRNKD